MSQNGIFHNGIFQNGIFQNGIFQNGIWQNGIFQNELWQLELPKELLATNPYTGKVLQYIYECAMRPDQRAEITVADGSKITLVGRIGLAPSWGNPGGTCDVSCQRWVSACVLARTNAYGVKVDISMRAPANAPEPIRTALEVKTDEERYGYTLREGAFYGNLFASTVDTAGIAVNAPTFYACAGPGSNIPELTKRFCSSQGAGGPIQVTGQCEPREDWSGAACDALVGGTLQRCHGGGTTYDEVITVYIQQPITTCGNAVCEAGEAESCKSDCLPGGWARSFEAIINDRPSTPG